MKFTAVVFRLIFLLLEVEGASVLDATAAMSKPKEAAHSTTPDKSMMSAAVPKVMHMSAQSTIPTKIVHSHAESPKQKVPMAALTGIKKSDGQHRPVAKRSTDKETTRKAFNKSNHWGLFGAQANGTAVNHTQDPKVHAQAKAVPSVKPATIVAPKNTPGAKTSVAMATTTSVPKATPAKSKPPVPPVNKTVSHATAVKAVPKETKAVPKETKAEMSKSTKQKVSNTNAVKAASKEVKSANANAANKTVSHATAVVKAAPNMPHVLVNAKAKSTSKSTVSLGTQNKAEYQLLNFLASEMERKELPPFEVYLPACLEHTHDLIDNLDMAYTDVQLHSVLVDECWLKKSFPKSYDSSFSTDDACKKFATQLMNARYLELQTYSQEGYEGFCADYYVHIGGNLGKKKKAEAPPPPKKKNTQSFPWHFVVVAAVILILFLIILCMVVHKRHAAGSA